MLVFDRLLPTAGTGVRGREVIARCVCILLLTTSDTSAVLKVPKRSFQGPPQHQTVIINAEYMSLAVCASRYSVVTQLTRKTHRGNEDANECNGTKKV